VDAAVEAIGRHHLTSSIRGGCPHFSGQAKDYLVELKGKHAINQHSRADIGEFYSRKLKAMGIYEGKDSAVGRALFRETLLPAPPSALPDDASQSGGRPIMPFESHNSESNRVMDRPIPRTAIEPFVWPLSSNHDKERFSKYYCFGREQVEVFCTNGEYHRANHHLVEQGQVGIRCKHCSHESFPGSLKNVHGSTVTQIDQHLMKNCEEFGQENRKELTKWKKKSHPLYAAGDRGYIQNHLRDLPMQDHPDPKKAIIVLRNISPTRDV
jgi:hypothetical protein